MFAIFDDRIEFTSPGLLPKTLDIEDIKAGRSEIRNKVLARFFKEIRFIEQWGTGIKRIISSCREMSLKEPEFKETRMFFKVTIFNECESIIPESSARVPESSEIVPEGSYKIPESVSNLNLKDLSDNEKIIIKYIRDNDKITTKIAAQLIGISTRGTRKVSEK